MGVDKGKMDKEFRREKGRESERGRRKPNLNPRRTRTSKSSVAELRNLKCPGKRKRKPWKVSR